MDFGFLFWRVVRFFGFDPQATLNWPIRLFWSAAAHVERLKAAEDLTTLELLQVGGSMGGGEAAKEYRAHLIERMGPTVRQEKPKTSRAEILAIMNEV